MYDIAHLLKSNYTIDAAGNQVKNAIRKEVFVSVESISQSEFFAAGQSGLRPQLKLIVFAYDYGGETSAEYEGAVYSIYRTYLSGDKLEIYLTEKCGE